MKIRNLTLPMAAVLSTSLPALAQLPNASQQVDSVQQRQQLDQALPELADTNAVPELYAGESSDLGPQSVLQVKPRRTLFKAFADEQYFYTDNMFLADHDKQGVDVLVSTVQAALAPSPYPVGGGLLSPQIGFQEQWFSYGLAGSPLIQIQNLANNQYQNVRLDYFDFNALTAFGNISWSRGKWTFTLGGDFRQLQDSDGYTEFYREYVPTWSVRRDFATSDTTALSIGYEGDYRITDTAYVPTGEGTDFNDRTDHAVFVAGSWRLCRFATLQPSYRFQYTHFTSIHREDYLNSFGLTLDCPITDQITLRTYISYDHLNTDGAFVNNFDQLAAGGGINLTVRF
jgi:hypothetical protein